MITTLDSGSLETALEGVKVIYTDLDGTMLAPGGTFLTSHDGTPSAQGPKLREQLESAGIELVIVTGRNRAQTTEISRILHVSTFIGELGGFSQTGFGENRRFRFNTGRWTAPEEDLTPVETMEREGIIARLLELHPGHAERVSVQITNAREVSTLIVGDFDPAIVAEEISTPSYPIDIIDNGEVKPAAISTLVVDKGIHIFHVLPRGVSKGEAVRIDMDTRGIDPATALALGDSCGDLSMAGVCGRFGLTGNGCEAPEVAAMVEREGLEVLGVEGRTIDGWSQYVSAVLGIA